MKKVTIKRIHNLEKKLDDISKKLDKLIEDKQLELFNVFPQQKAFECQGGCEFPNMMVGEFIPCIKCGRLIQGNFTRC